MTFWLFSGVDQKSGRLMISSSFANCDLRAGASKIAPHSVSLLAERNVFSFQFVQGHDSIVEFSKAAAIAHIRRSLFGRS
jgi:hypothetical protein